MSYQSGPWQSFVLPNASQSAGASFVNIGTTREGFNLVETFHKQDVHDDLYGEESPEGILQGVSYSLSGVNIELDKLLASGVVNVQAIYGGFANQFVGYRARDIAPSLCLTPMPGTPAAKRIGAGNSWIFYAVILMNDLNVLLSSKLSEVPLDFKIYPIGPTPAYNTNSPGINSYWTYAATPSGCAYTFTPASFT